MTTTHLLYLHGFRSSPGSTKSRMVAEHVRTHHPQLTWWCPQLPPSPREAAQMLMAGIAGWPRAGMAVIGSSLGGFYAGWIAEQTGCRAVLLNPAVHPARDLARHIGEQTAWHDPNERFYFHAAYVDELRAMESPPDSPAAQAAMARMFAIIAKGDEVLDWREMAARYPLARIRLLEGSDHAISDFAAHLDEVFAFLMSD
jgi:predicted esterase YcpF (UPF0227 family)